MQVLKFGGTSVGTVDSIAQVASIIAHARAHDPATVVVTSAMSGVTNELIAAAQAAANGHADAYRQTADALRAKHAHVAAQLVPDASVRAAVEQVIARRLQEMVTTCDAIRAAGTLPPHLLDVVAGMGERLAAPLLAAVVAGQGMATEAVDATELIVTNGAFGGAEPRMAPTRAQTRQRLQPLLAQGVVPVCTGYIGATADGAPTTLGRGGSDYSAAILGACLDATEIQIWTDVDGILTADPRVVADARTLAEISYSEAAELSYFGAKVLHPKTVLPAVQQGIPLRILNTFNPAHPGTRVVKAGDGHDEIKSVTAMRDLCLIALAGRDTARVLGLVTEAFSSLVWQDVNVLMLPSLAPEYPLCFAVPQKERQRVLPLLQHQLANGNGNRPLTEIQVQEHIVILCIVGMNLTHRPELAQQVAATLAEGHIETLAVGQRASDAHVTLVAIHGDANDAVRRLHAAFRLHEVPTLHPAL